MFSSYFNKPVTIKILCPSFKFGQIFKNNCNHTPHLNKFRASGSSLPDCSASFNSLNACFRLCFTTNCRRIISASTFSWSNFFVKALRTALGWLLNKAQRASNGLTKALFIEVVSMYSVSFKSLMQNCTFYRKRPNYCITN